MARDRLLVMRSPGDEASIILLSARVLLAVGMVAMRLLARVCGAIEAALKRSRAEPIFGWALALVVVAGWMALLWLATWVLPMQATVAAWLLVLVAVSAFVLVMPIGMNALGDGDANLSMQTWHWLLAVAMLAVVILPSLLLVFYGWQLAVANLEVDVSAEATPPGDWRVVTLTSTTAFGDSSVAALTHSALYDDQRAIELLGDWVQQVLDDEAALLRQRAD